MRAWATARAWRSVSRRPARTWAITIRRFGTRSFSAAQLVEQGALPEHIRHAAEQTLHTRRNILVSGGTGSGKTTLLNALIALIPDDERIVAIEDTLELRIDSPNCVRFEARGAPTRRRHDPRPGAARLATPPRSHRRRRSARRRGRRPLASPQHRPWRIAHHRPRQQRRRAPCRAWRAAPCRAAAISPWEVTCRGVVDGIAMVIHMTRADGPALRGRSRVRPGATRPGATHGR